MATYRIALTFTGNVFDPNHTTPHGDVYVSTTGPLDITAEYHDDQLRIAENFSYVDFDSDVEGIVFASANCYRPDGLGGSDHFEGADFEQLPNNLPPPGGTPPTCE